MNWLKLKEAVEEAEKENCPHCKQWTSKSALGASATCGSEKCDLYDIMLNGAPVYVRYKDGYMSVE